MRFSLVFGILQTSVQTQPGSHLLSWTSCTRIQNIKYTKLLTIQTKIVVNLSGRHTR